ncbi:deoxyribonuclease-1-like [Narcine bancroftii]|uniref:deoxyribonuclease-1-like n=1 Tax=Narcine bancroftii TaxID=1343680 RepID=UPI003831F8EB
MKIAAFNIQRLGTNKISQPTIVSRIVKILLRYDIILIMEVFDKTGDVSSQLLDELNKQAASHYSSTLSNPLGRGSYKEQYLFIYRNDMVQMERFFQYDDMQLGDEDAFSREPFVIQFKSPTTDLSTLSLLHCQDEAQHEREEQHLVFCPVVQDFVLIPLHTTPKDSVKEIDELYDVTQKVIKDWNTENIMILGDFNADGDYVSKRKMKTIRLRTDSNFHWLIGDDEDTTARLSTDQAYDRIVVYGNTFYQGIVPNSAKTFNFQEELQLTEEQALDISDHYPVEVELKLV